MSILMETNNCCLLDHRGYLVKLYSKVMDNSHGVSCFKILKFLFHMVNTKYSKDVDLKRKHKSSEYHEETIRIKFKYNLFINQIPTSLKDELYNGGNIESAEVRQLSQKLFEGTLFDHIGLSGGNNIESPLKCKIRNEYFLIPQNSRFHCGCVKEQCQKLDGNKYNILVADPPWWNKYIRRLKNANEKLSYSMMYNKDIANIPVRNLLATDCLVAVWCTNAPSNIDAVKNIIFPKWGVEYVTTWYWLKVTIDLKPIYPFSTVCKKQPYERIIIGKVGNVKDIPEEKIIISVPSALHSHKPPLLDILKPFVHTDNPEILELFARYLLPNTTSVGYEPLKWQHLSLYELVTDK